MAQTTDRSILNIRPKRKLSWLKVLLIGLLLYIVGIAVLVATGNPTLFPTVVLLGSFMVPAAYVAFFYERRDLSDLTMSTTALGFFYGGVLGVFAASLLEPLFIHYLNLATVMEIGLIEEFVKILGILVIARRMRRDSELNGLILGAAAGMGFAALESTGYAFNAFLISGGSLSAAVIVTLIRGLLSPVGHGTWSAILAGVLFRESGPKHFRLNLKVVGAFLTVAVLHGLWDGLPDLITTFVSSGVDVIIGQSIVAAIGLFILWRLWHEAKRRQIEKDMITPVFGFPRAMDSSGTLPDLDRVLLLGEEADQKEVNQPVTAPSLP
jgi:RsiW-degrading membrane proteinase PrsW (M82 family)